jgi:hypothetical protein
MFPWIVAMVEVFAVIGGVLTFAAILTTFIISVEKEVFILWPPSIRRYIKRKHDQEVSQYYWNVSTMEHELGLLPCSREDCRTCANPVIHTHTRTLNLRSTEYSDPTIDSDGSLWVVKNGKVQPYLSLKGYDHVPEPPLPNAPPERIMK